jgi:hypothetical protein
MTLVRTTTRKGLPAVVGDFLITIPGTTFSEARKKVHVLRPSFTVAWTGHQYAAAEVIGALRERLPSEPTREQIEEVLTSFRKGALGKLQAILLGSLATRPRAFLFRWNSDWPHEVYPVENASDGSGFRVAERVLGDVRLEPLPGPEALPGAQRLVKMATRSGINRLIEDELRTQSMRALGCGLAYEATFFDGTSFTFLQDILYLSGEVRFTDSGRFALASAETTILRCRPSAEFSAFEVLNYQEGSCRRYLAQTVDSTGLPEAAKDLNERMHEEKRLWPETPGTVCAVLWLSGAGVPGVLPVLMTDEEPAVGRMLKVQFEGDGILPPVSITPNPDELERVYRAILSDVRSGSPDSSGGGGLTSFRDLGRGGAPGRLP